MIVRHGGVFVQYMDGKTMVTHIIASSLTPKKKVEFAKYKIVKPQWIVDSIEAGVLLPWSDYKVVEEAPGQSLIGFGAGAQSSKKVVSQRNRANNSYKEVTSLPISTAIQLSNYTPSPAVSTSREYRTRSFTKRNFDVVIYKKRTPVLQSGPTQSEVSPGT